MRKAWARRLRRLPPAAQVTLSFLALIGLGTGLLLSPAATPVEQRIGFVDALFTATSAACVTGLAVRDTGTGFTFFGQAVLLLLIQVGGLGVMTFALAFFVLGGRASLAQRALAEGSFLGTGTPELRSLVRLVFVSTLGLELVGTLLLFAVWGDDAPPERAAWLALFHAVSAFCNAGFSLFPDNLMRFRSDLPVNLIVAALIVLGGLGFFVLHDLARRWREPRRLSLHSKLVLATSALLLLGGMAAIVRFEAQRSFAPLAPAERLLAGFFQSVTARTAGFNTVDLAALAPHTLLLMMILMFVGGSPGSCAGGIKTTAAAAIGAAAWARVRGHRQINVFARTLSLDAVHSAFVLALLVLGAAFLGLFVLLAFESGNGSAAEPHFVDLAFETFSALGTVGLSTGITPRLSGASRITLSLLMFIGRVGPLVLAAVLMSSRRELDFRFPTEEVMIG